MNSKAKGHEKKPRKTPEKPQKTQKGEYTIETRLKYMTHWSGIMRGIVFDSEGNPPTMPERIKAASLLNTVYLCGDSADMSAIIHAANETLGKNWEI